MARPCDSITGVSMLISELDAKRLEVLKEILPSARRFGCWLKPIAWGESRRRGYSVGLSAAVRDRQPFCQR
jgi:hypothetical protein